MRFEQFAVHRLVVYVAQRVLSAGRRVHCIKCQSHTQDEPVVLRAEGVPLVRLDTDVGAGLHGDEGAGAHVEPDRGHHLHADPFEHLVPVSLFRERIVEIHRFLFDFLLAGRLPGILVGRIRPALLLLSRVRRVGDVVKIDAGRPARPLPHQKGARRLMRRLIPAVVGDGHTVGDVHHFVDAPAGKADPAGGRREHDDGPDGAGVGPRPVDGDDPVEPFRVGLNRGEPLGDDPDVVDPGHDHEAEVGRQIDEGGPHGVGLGRGQVRLFDVLEHGLGDVIVAPGRVELQLRELVRLQRIVFRLAGPDPVGDNVLHGKLDIRLQDRVFMKPFQIEGGVEVRQLREQFQRPDVSVFTGVLRDFRVAAGVHVRRRQFENGPVREGAGLGFRVERGRYGFVVKHLGEVGRGRRVRVGADDRVGVESVKPVPYRHGDFRVAEHEGLGRVLQVPFENDLGLVRFDVPEPDADPGPFFRGAEKVAVHIVILLNASSAIWTGLLHHAQSAKTVLGLFTYERCNKTGL